MAALVRTADPLDLSQPYGCSFVVDQIKKADDMFQQINKLLFNVAILEVSMDEDRRIRFLIAPTLFIASLLLGALSDHASCNFVVAALEHHDWPKLIAAIAGGGLVVFVGGYVIGTWTYFVLRLIFQFRPERWGKSRFHEVAMSDGAFKQVWGRVGYGSSNRSQELSAGYSGAWRSGASDNRVTRSPNECNVEDRTIADIWRS